MSLLDSCRSVYDILDTPLAEGASPEITLVGRTGAFESSTREELRDASLQWGAWFAERIEPGDRVALCLPTSTDFLHAFFGVQLAGGVAVPLASMVPHQEEYIPPFLESRVPVLDDCGAAILVTSEDFAPVMRRLPELCAHLEQVITAADVDASADDFTPVTRGHEDLAMLQYTSGSTGQPKGVELTHHCLLWNLDAITDGAGVKPGDSCVSWLPLYHDMGLIGGCLWPMAVGITTTLMATEVFLTDPSFWLQAMSTKQATITVAPNFGYALSVKRVEPSTVENLDLSNLRIMLCGAEPIDHEVLAAFQDKFAAARLPSDVILPVYGLAEATLAVTFTERGAPVRVARLDRQRLEEDGIAEDATDSSATVADVVCVGKPLLDNELRIIDEDGATLPEDRQGEILVRSGSLMRGYFRNEEATAKTLRDGWLHTGDLGFLRDGDLYITGRIKDLIITYGRNFYPHDIERIAAAVDRVRNGCVVAFPLHNEEESTDEIAVVAETRATDRKDLIVIRREIRKRLINSIECNPKYVTLVPPREVPKTTSGKLRRAEASRMYQDGEFTTLL